MSGSHDGPEQCRCCAHILLFFNCRERRRASATNVRIVFLGCSSCIGLCVLTGKLLCSCGDPVFIPCVSNLTFSCDFVSSLIVSLGSLVCGECVRPVGIPCFLCLVTFREGQMVCTSCYSHRVDDGVEGESPRGHRKNRVTLP